MRLARRPSTAMGRSPSAQRGTVRCPASAIRRVRCRRAWAEGCRSCRSCPRLAPRCGAPRRAAGWLSRAGRPSTTSRAPSRPVGSVRRRARPPACSRCASAALHAVLHEQHGRLGGPHFTDDTAQVPREDTALSAGELAQRGNETDLRDLRRRAKQRAPGRREREHDAPAVFGGAIARDEAAPHEAIHHHRDRALVGERARGQVIQRLGGRFGECVEDEQLGAAHAQPSFGGARGNPERLDDAADGIERGGEVDRIFPRVGPGGPANHIGGHVRLNAGVCLGACRRRRHNIRVPTKSAMRPADSARARQQWYWQARGTCRYLHCRFAVANPMGSCQFRIEAIMVDRRRHGVLLVICWLLSAALFVFLFITYHDTKLSYSMYFPGMPLYGAMTWWFFFTIPLIGWTWGFFNDLKDSIEPEPREGPTAVRTQGDRRWRRR